MTEITSCKEKMPQRIKAEIYKKSDEYKREVKYSQAQTVKHRKIAEEIRDTRKRLFAEEGENITLASLINIGSLELGAQFHDRSADHYEKIANDPEYDFRYD